MIIFPAIDLKDGTCVRLKKGVMEDATVFNTDPAAQARSFATQGFQWLHCVDLNGAFAGHSANTDAIRSIRAAIDLPIQLGGGILMLASCSHNIPAERFAAECAAGLHRAGRPAALIRQAGAGPDHPVHPFLPESAYLKALAYALD